MDTKQKYTDSLLTELFDKSDSILLLIDKSGEILLANPRFYKGVFFEISNKKSPGNLYDYFQIQSEKAQLKESVKASMGEKEVKPFKLTHQYNGKLFHFECILSFLEDQHCLVKFDDVSEHVILKKNISEFEEYRTYFRQNTSIIIIIIDEKGYIRGLNKGAEIKLGYSTEEVYGSDNIWKNLFPSRSSRKKALGYFYETVSDSVNEHVFSVQSKNKQIKTINFYKQKIVSSDGVFICTMILGVDISEKVKTEASLIESEKKYRHLIDLLPEVIFEVDIKGNMKFINRHALDIFGYSQEEFKKGLNVYQMIAPSDLSRAKANIRRFLKGEISGKGGEYLAVKKNGKEFPILVFNEKMIENKKTVGIRGILIDISERKNYENFLKSAKEKAEESDRLKSTFLANMSHEIRTPMNGIMGFTELLKDPNLAYHERRQFLDIITNSGKHLLNLINDIIDISKIEAGQLIIDKEEFSINTLLKDVHSFFQTEVETKEQDLKLILKNGLPYEKSFIYTDSVRLRQILNNLVGNAVKFTKTGTVEFGYYLEEGHMKFFVKDTGIGLSEEHIQIIFERFAQAENNIERKYGGTGLGLAICKGVVDLLGGNIWVKSKVGKGSDFYFSIPYTPTTITIEEYKNEEILQDIDWSKKRILIAEDDDASFELLKALLSSTRVNMVRVKNGLDVVTTYKNDPKFDLILMDIQLPRLDGIEATKQLKVFNKAVPVIAQTANAMIQHKRDCFKAGCDDYITKPLDFKTLIVKLKTYLS